MNFILPPLIFFAALAPAQAPEEAVWARTRIPGIPFSAELPEDAKMKIIDVSNPDLPDGARVWGRQFMIENSTEDRLLAVMMRLERIQGWVPGASEGWDKLPPTKASAPAIKKWRGHKVYEFVTERKTDGIEKLIVSANYVIVLGAKDYVRLELNCGKTAFKRYVPYYTRVRDSLEPAAGKP